MEVMERWRYVWRREEESESIISSVKMKWRSGDEMRCYVEAFDSLRRYKGGLYR